MTRKQRGASSRSGGRRRDRRQMERLLRRRERRGLTYAELSAQSGVPISTLQWWRRRLAQEPAGSDPEQRSPVRFVEAIVAAPADARGRYEVVLESGRRLVLEEGFEADSVRTLIGLLDGPC